MKTDKNVSRRRFLLVGALTGGGLVLSESGCAPNVNQKASTGSPKTGRTFVQRRGNPPPKLEDTYLRHIVDCLKYCHPILRDIDNNIVPLTISGTVKSNASAEFDAKLGTSTITLYHFLSALLPSIEFTVSGVTYVLTVTGGNMNDTTPLVNLSLVDIFTMLKSYCIQVHHNNVVVGEYNVSGADLDSKCHPGLHDKIGGDTLDVIADSLAYMTFYIDSCPSTAHAVAHPMTVYVACNKTRKE